MKFWDKTQKDCNSYEKIVQHNYTYNNDGSFDIYEETPSKDPLKFTSECIGSINIDKILSIDKEDEGE